MAKSKNHTAHNQTRKAHKNGIKRAPPMYKFRAERGGFLPRIVNSRRARKGNQVASRKRRQERLKAFRATK